MQIIRDEEMGGIMMIPLFIEYGINRCNLTDCKEKPTTICIHEQVNFGMCEKHYLERKDKGNVKLKLQF